jgi:hypothetical protein
MLIAHTSVASAVVIVWRAMTVPAQRTSKVMPSTGRRISTSWPNTFGGTE